MAGLSLNHQEAMIFGILGNIISFMVYLAPLPTFYRVYKKKSTEEFQCIPYLVALFSAMLWIYYALEKKDDAYLLITINSLGCAIETAYIIMYLIYAPRIAKIFTIKLFLALNMMTFGLILLLTLLLSHHTDRVRILGWLCMCFSVSVFVAPLSIIRMVIRTKSVEFMPFWLSFFLTLSAIVWFAYGLATSDKFVALPNVLGFIFGILQMLLYIAYKDKKEVVIVEKLPEHVITIAKLGVAEKGSEVHPIDQKLPAQDNDDQEGKKGVEGEPKEHERTIEMEEESMVMVVQKDLNVNHVEV